MALNYFRGSHIYSIWQNKGGYGGKLFELLGGEKSWTFCFITALHNYEVEADGVIICSVICRMCSQSQKGNSIRGNGFSLFFVIV